MATKNRPSVKDVTWYTENDTKAVKVESGDATWPDGYFHRGGAYRVTPKNKTKNRVRLFWGETAWSDAARYAEDVAWSVRFDDED